MGAQYKPVKGDRVRVVLEGEVTDDDTSAGFTVEHEVPFFYDDPGLISIEKIEPPVEVFGAGVTLRHLLIGSLYSIAADGYFSHATGRFYKWAPDGLTRREHFNSGTYERVNLS